ncbi:MAG: hypothetical protein LBB88_09360 [Planctomycetaceae bacterium]|nr:hypothetical protein [Planctomycetaceae bacterium]
MGGLRGQRGRWGHWGRFCLKSGIKGSEGTKFKRKKLLFLKSCCFLLSR